MISKLDEGLTVIG